MVLKGKRVKVGEAYGSETSSVVPTESDWFKGTEEN